MAERKKTNRQSRSLSRRIAAALLCAAMLLTALGVYVPVQAENENTKEIVGWTWGEAEKVPVRADGDTGWELDLDTDGEEAASVTREELKKLLPSEIRAVVKSGGENEEDDGTARPEPETAAEPGGEEEPTAEVLTFEEAPEPDGEEPDETPDEAVPTPGEPEPTPGEATPTPEAQKPAPTQEPTPIPEAQEPEEPSVSPTPGGEAEEETESESLELQWDISGYPEEGAQTGEYTLSAALPDGYTLPDGSQTLSVTVMLRAANDIEELLKQHQVKAAEQTGTTIDAFDYWLDGQNAVDTEYGANEDLDFFEQGINAKHCLLFGYNTTGWELGGIATGGPSNNKGDLTWNNNGRWNSWTGKGSGPANGIVKSTLVNGYPKLNLDADTWANADKEKLKDRPTDESLAYLFDTSVPSDGKASYPDVGGLLQIDDEGYFYYNSQQNFASLKDGDDKNFVLYDQKAVGTGGSTPEGQFFPFNMGKEVFIADGNGGIKANSKNSKDGTINHYFGLHMRTSFFQDYDGKTDDGENAKDVTYTFAGDDDVWIFIDDVLVADLGGIHDAVRVEINFRSGKIEISSASRASETFEPYTSTIKKQFEKAERGDAFEWNDKTFPDKTYHTLDFFYLERGNTDSDMDLKFNLLTIPESSVVKVDQLGNKLAGVKFSLYQASLNGEEYVVKEGNSPIATGITGPDGSFVFKDSKNPNRNLSLQELFDECADDNGNAYFILREEKTLDGYRSAGDIWLRMEECNNNVVLLGSNPWSTGAYASAGVYVTIKDNTVTTIDGKIKELEKEKKQNGTLFAVPVKLEKDESGIEGYQGYVITGDVTNGWTTHTEATDLEGILQILKKNTRNYHVFGKSPNGLYTTTISDLPGDITKYYYMMEAGDRTEAEYSVAYYYTEANSIDGATTGNTWLVKSENLDRVFSTNIYVPNIKNYLLVQKLGENGNPLNGADFALYRSSDVTENTESGLQINESAVPFMTGTTENHKKGEDGGLINLDGGIIFGEKQPLGKGTYYLVETAPPDGYEKIDNFIRVVVSDTGVYADAGEAGDGVAVQRGMGSLVKSMLQFAAEDDVDATLNQIMASFYTADSDAISFDEKEFDEFNWRGEGAAYIPAYTKENGKYRRYNPNTDADAEATSPMHTKYEGNAAVLEYGIGEEFEKELQSGEKGVIAQETDVGWSYLMMEQCQEHITEYPHTPLEEIDLTNLFSGTVLVKVTNYKGAELSIAKNLSYGEGINTSDTRFANVSFTFNLTLEGLSQEENSYDYRVVNTAGEIKESGTLTFGPKNGEENVYVIGSVTALPSGTSSYITETDGAYKIYLKPGEILKISGLPNATEYTVTEEETDGFKLSGITIDGAAAVNTENTASGTASGIERVVFINIPEGSITITKRDSEGGMLEGAKFAVYEYSETSADHIGDSVGEEKQVELKIKEPIEENNPNYDQACGRITVDEQTYIVHNGQNSDGTPYLYYYRPITEVDDSANAEAIAEFSGLDITKKYVIVETEAPAGYEKASPILGTGDGKDGISLPLENDGVLAYDILFTVINRKGVVLPNSGQFGPLIYIMLGADLAGGGATYLLWQKKRKQRMKNLKRYKMR